jgi:ATP-dependent Lon protease
MSCVCLCTRVCMCVHSSQANKRDYDELADNLREGITAHFAERYEEVYEIAFAEDD